VGAIYVVRNPLDVAVSLAPYLGLPLDLTIRTMAATLTAPPPSDLLAPEIWGSWTENVRSWTTEPPPVIKVMRYEDMLADPVAACTAIAEHMRIGASPAEIAEAVAASSFERARGRGGGERLCRTPRGHRAPGWARPASGARR
jgi:hypothetical protein